MRRPRVTLKCVADTYSGPHERVIEFSDPELDPGDGTGAPGGLIRFARTPEGRLVVSVYRVDGPVDVVGPAVELPERGKSFPVATAGELRQVLAALPDDTAIGLRISGTTDVPGVAPVEDVFTDALRRARLVEAAEHLPYRYRLTLAGQGAL